MTAIALTIAGSDSSGGAGIQADLKTFAALGVYGASVITALTAQNTQGVSAIYDVPPGFIGAQIDAVFADLAVGAVKIGMLFRPATVKAAAEGLARHRARNVVLDPVTIASSGDSLLAGNVVEAMRRRLIPHTLVVTPNLAEAAALTGATPARSEREMEIQAREILSLGARNVLIKGGHADGDECVDLLDRRGRGRAAVGEADRDQEHARHRLHVVVGDRGGARQGARRRHRLPGGQGLRHRGDRARRRIQRRPRPRAAASFSPVVAMMNDPQAGCFTRTALRAPGDVGRGGVERSRHRTDRLRSSTVDPPREGDSRRTVDHRRRCPSPRRPSPARRR